MGAVSEMFRYLKVIRQMIKVMPSQAMDPKIIVSKFTFNGTFQLYQQLLTVFVSLRVTGYSEALMLQYFRIPWLL